MTLEQTIQAVPAMTVADRLRLADAIWDSLHDTDIPPLTSEQRTELDRRIISCFATTWDYDGAPLT